MSVSTGALLGSPRVLDRIPVWLWLLMTTVTPQSLTRAAEMHKVIIVIRRHLASGSKTEAMKAISSEVSTPLHRRLRAAMLGLHFTRVIYPKSMTNKELLQRNSECLSIRSTKCTTISTTHAA